MGEIIGITFENMDNAKTNLNKANEVNLNIKTNLSSAMLSLQVECLFSNLMQSQEAIRVQVYKVDKRMDDIDKVITHVDYAVQRFQEVDANYAATIKGKIDQYTQQNIKMGSNGSFGGLAAIGGAKNLDAVDLLAMGDINALDPTNKSSDQGYNGSYIRQGTGIVMEEGKVEEPSWKNAFLEASTSYDSKIDYLVTAAETMKKKELITAANDIYHSTISNSSSKREMYTKMFDEAVIPADNLRNEAALIGEGGVNSVGARLGVAGAIVGGGVSIYDDVRNDKYDNVDKTKAVTIDVTQTAATIGVIVAIAAIPFELPVLATIGVMAIGIGLCTVINKEAQEAKKEWID